MKNIATEPRSRRHLVDGTRRPSTRVVSLTTRPAFGGTAVRPTDGPILFVSLVLGAAVALLVALTLMNGSVDDLNLPFGETPGLERVLDQAPEPAVEASAPAAQAPAPATEVPASAGDTVSSFADVPPAVPAPSLAEAF